MHLLGARRIGKTSLLKRLESVEHHALYFNLQRTGGSWTNFQKGLQQAIRRKARHLAWLPDLSAPAASDVCETLYLLDEAAEDHGQRCWLLFDETEVLVYLGREDIRTLQMFQAVLRDTNALTKVFASAKQLTELDTLTSSVDYGTPFLHHFPPPVFIAGLDQPDAIHLIRQMQGDSPLAVPEATVMRLCQWTGNHPFYLQWLCHTIWQHNPDPTSWHVDEGILELSRSPQLERILQDDFDHLSLPERQVLEAVLWQQPMKPANRIYLHGLVHLGYLRCGSDTYEIGNELLKTWLLDLSAEQWTTPSRVVADATRRMYAKTYPGGDVLETPLLVQPHTPDASDDPAMDVAGQLYGTHRRLTIEDVRAIVARCLAFTQRGGKVAEFHRRFSNGDYALETLRSWLRDKRFHPQS